MKYRALKNNLGKLGLGGLVAIALSLSISLFYLIELNRRSDQGPLSSVAAVNAIEDVKIDNHMVNQIPQPSIVVLGGIQESKMYFNDDKGIMNAEVTPWSLSTRRTGGWYTYLISTYDTFMCTTPSNMFDLITDEKIVDRNNCRLRLEPGLNPTNFNNPNSVPLWYRDYHGVFSAHLIPQPNKEIYLYSINHSESYNNSGLAVRFPGQQVPPCVPVADMGYGILPCEDRYWWGSYNAWITMSRMPWTYANLVGSTKFSDLGPITWPSNGYIESLDKNKTWIKATDGGVRTPSSIIKDNYLYVFYEDLSQGKESEGRGPGIKVIRAPIVNGVINPNSFKAYYNGDFVDNTLPANFSLPTYYRSLAWKGPRTTSLFPELNKIVPNATLGTKRPSPRVVGDVISFSVAKVEGTDYYLGVAHELSRGITLRLSKDLVHWSSPTIVPGTENDWWLGDTDLQKYPLLYPRLANRNGDSNVSIDKNEFYIIGTQTKLRNGAEAKVVNQIKLRLSISNVN